MIYCVLERKLLQFAYLHRMIKIVFERQIAKEVSKVKKKSIKGLYKNIIDVKLKMNFRI